MDEPYEITFDPSPPLLRYKLRGFWDLATYEAFTRDFFRTLQQAGLGPHDRFDILNDATEFPVQSAEIAKAMMAARRQSEQGFKGRCATIVASALGRAQAQRTFDHGHARTFTSEEEARRWLDQERVEA